MHHNYLYFIKMFLFLIISITINTLIIRLHNYYLTNKNIEEINNITITNNTIDFDSLLSINQDIIGYLIVPGTNINYPVVQTDNNSYYLNHDFNQKPNKMGWIFMDYRNNSKMNDNNTIIYGHAIISHNIMFGSLYNILNKSWQSNSNNYLIKYYTKDYTYQYQVFSTYIIPKETYYLQINLSDINNFYQTLLKRSNYHYPVNITSNDKILTLSTCYKNNSRLVLHAKLIK
jgi:sortase B